MHKRILSKCSVSTCLACFERSESRARVKYSPRKTRGKTGGKGRDSLARPSPLLLFPCFPQRSPRTIQRAPHYSDYRKRPRRQRIERCDLRSIMSYLFQNIRLMNADQKLYLVQGLPHSPMPFQRKIEKSKETMKSLSPETINKGNKIFIATPTDRLE